MTTRLLRASSFCRHLNAQTIIVSVELLEDKKGGESTVYGPAELLVQLSIRNGDVVWLSFDGSKIPAALCVDEEIVGVTKIKIPPTMFYFGALCCTVQACAADVKIAERVSIAPVGRPTRSSIFQDNTSIEYPPISPDRRLVASGVLLPVVRNNDVFVYQVLSDGPYWTSSDTLWTLTSFPSDFSIPRLPALDRTQSFLLRDPFQECLHPALDTVTKALQIHMKSPASHKILHVLGSTANHVDLCVKASSHSLGRRYLKVHGLAAFAHCSGRTVTTGSTQDKLNGCQAALDQAQESAPCILHILNIEDELPTNDEDLRLTFEMRLWTMLTESLRLKLVPATTSSSRSVPPVVVVVSSRAPLSPGPLHRSLVLSTVVITQPDEAYARSLWGDDLTATDAMPHLIGHTALDICKWKRMWLNSRRYKTFENVAAFFENLVHPVSHTSLRIPDVRWEDIGGLYHVRKEIMDAIELPLQFPILFQGTRRSGILLFGPPGTGKTLVAKAVATECGLPFFSVKGPELLGSYVGESEANVRQVFTTAREVAERNNRAAVVFFDELDSLSPRRGGLGDGGGVMERVVATLLTELDRDDTVFFIGATNRPDLLDPSLLRPGRLDRRVYLGLPTEQDERAQILAALIRKFPLERNPDSVKIARQVVDCLPKNLSGADFAAIASGAMARSLMRLCEFAERQVTPLSSLDDVLDKLGNDINPMVYASDFIASSQDIVPSLTEHELCRYQYLRDEFCSVGSSNQQE